MLGVLFRACNHGGEPREVCEQRCPDQRSGHCDAPVVDPPAKEQMKV
jgi:hypothetical protein